MSVILSATRIGRIFLRLTLAIVITIAILIAIGGYKRDLEDNRTRKSSYYSTPAEMEKGALAEMGRGKK